jgi:phosphatidylserine/phosphatidylglycerophosphate/cardiolipin synthase-like enzyme
MPRSSSVQRERLSRAAAVQLVVDRDHYDDVILGALTEARVSVWIATANVKDVHVEAPVGTRARARGRYLSITERFVELVRSGVEIRLLHGALPSRPYRESLERARELVAPGFEMRHCPRVHLKLIAVDGRYLYLGSANFTGAGLGAKSEGRRNFEMGLSSDDDVLLDAAQSRFERIWTGKECGSCQLRNECPAPLDRARDSGVKLVDIKRTRRHAALHEVEAKPEIRRAAARKTRKVRA